MGARLRSPRISGGDGKDAPVASLNLLLDRLPENELELLFKQSQRLTLDHRQIMYEPHDPIENV